MGNIKSGTSIPIVSNLSGMGNVQREFENFVGDSPLRLMNEDTFLIVLKYLTVQDYVQLSTLCHKFEQLFGQNNFLWAQVCEGFAKPLLEPYTYPDPYVMAMPSPNPPSFADLAYRRIRPQNVAKLLLEALQNPSKDIVMEIQRLERDGMNLRDKSIVNKFDFKSALKQYYIRYLHLSRLQSTFGPYTNRTNALNNIAVLPFTNQMGDVWSRTDLKKNKSAKDYYYEVDFGVNPEKLEQMIMPRQTHSGPALSTSKAEPLPFEIGGRLVVYKNSAVEPRKQLFISRMPARRIVPSNVPRAVNLPSLGPAPAAPKQPSAPLPPSNWSAELERSADSLEYLDE